MRLPLKFSWKGGLEWDFTSEEEKKRLEKAAKVVPKQDLVTPMVQDAVRYLANIPVDVAKQIDPEAEYKPENFISKFLFKNKPLQGNVQYGKETLKSFGAPESTAEKFKVPAALGLGLLDLSVPGVDDITKQAFKEGGDRAIKEGIEKVAQGGLKNKILKLFKTEKPVQETPEAVTKFIQALKEAKPVRKAQEALYTAERSKRSAEITEAGKIGGEKGFFAQLSKLKGELPKAQYESVRGNLNQADIDELFNTIENTRLLPYEKISAKTGLAKMLDPIGSSVPNESQLKLLNEVFPPEFMKVVQSKKPLMERLSDLGIEVLNTPRALMASFDVSAPFRQGVFLVGRPKQWAPAFVDMFKYLGSDKAYKGAMEEIASRPTYKLMREHNLALTDMGQLSKREEAFMSSLAEKIPGIGIGIKASNRAYSGFLNKLRADVFDDMVRKAKEMGIEDPTTLRGIADYVNTATGRGSLGKLEGKAAILNATLFSPKLMASRLKLLSPTYYMSLPPQVRREAVKDLFRFTALGMSILGLAKLSGASVEEDPRNPDFAKIKVGNTRYDIFGGFSQYIRLAAQLITGETVSSKTGEVRKLGEGYKPDTRKDVLERFVESKESPILSFATKLLEGKDYLGNEFNVGKEIIGMTLPFVVQDMYDLYKEWGPSGIPMSIPGIVGVGSQTYGKEIPTMGETSSGNPTIKMTPVPGLPETIYNELTNTPVSNIPEEQWGDIMQAREAGKAATEKKTQEKATSEETAKKLFDLLSTVPEGEKPAKVEDMINSGQISNDVAKKLNDLIKKSSYSPVSEEGKIISALGSNEEKANYIINYINKNPDSKKEFMSDLINSGVINNSLAKLIIERSGE